MKKTIYSLGVAIFLGCSFASGQTWHKYTFNSGNANNDVAAVNNGTVTGAVLTTDRFGNANKAYDFGTTGTSKIDCGNITIMNNTANLTITGWYQKPANTVIREMFCKPDAAGSIRARTYNDATQLYGYSGTQFTGAPTNATNYTSIATGTWFHFALVINTTTNSMKTYINGVQYSQGSAGTTGGTLPFLIGNVPAAMSTGQGWQGKLDDIFMVNRSLSVTQIDSLRNLPNPVAPTVWLKYSFNAGTTVNDLGANNTGTLSAGSLTTDRFGNVNQAYNSPSINCGTVSGFNASPKFTFCGWYKKPAAGTNYSMYSIDNHSSIIYAGDPGFQNAPVAVNNNKYTNPFSNTTYSNIAVGAWFHYAVVMNPSTGTIRNYINGVQFASTSLSGDVLTGTGNLKLGSPSTSILSSFFGNQWSTDMDDIFAVNAALTTTQIDSLRNLPNPGQVNTNTCVANAPVNVTPQANLTLCSGAPLTLSVTASGTVNWYATPTGTTSIATGSVYTTPILASGNYTYYTDNTEACGTSTGRTPISFVINSTPTVTALLSNNGAICITGTGVNLTLSGAATYTVSNGVTTYTSTGGVSSLYPTSTTVYTINGTSAQGCLNPIPVSVTVNVSSNPTITASNGTICSGSSFTINPSGATSYTYSGGGSAVVSPTTNTTYVVTGSNGVCSSTKNVTVTVNPKPNAIVFLQPNAVFCPGAVTEMGYTNNSYSVTVNGILSAEDGFGKYTYSATTTQTLNYVYTNTLTGCATVQPPIVYNVLFNTITISSSSANPICAGQSAILTASVAGTPANLAWSNASALGNTTTITPTVTTTYTIAGQDQAGYGCNYSATYTQSVSTCTSTDINEITNNTLLSVYPNPVNDFVTVDFSNTAIELTDNTKIYIINALGEIVLTERVTSSSKTFNTERLTNGIYFIKVESKNGSAIEKFIKQ